MRISGGSARGRKVGIRKAFAVRPEGDELRPTSAKVRKALFDILGPRIVESRFLDLYAGSGAVGIEALSRGSDRAVFIEDDPRRAMLIRDVAEHFGFGEKAEIVKQKALSYVVKTREAFDIVFLDPPYASEDLERVLAILGPSTVLADDALVIAEHASKKALPPEFPHLIMKKTYRYGDTALTVYTKKH